MSSVCWKLARVIKKQHILEKLEQLSDVNLNVEKISEKANRVRKSIYVDYYSLSTNPYKDYKLDFKNHWFNHGTRFVMPSFMHYLKRKNFLYSKINLDYLVNKFFSK